MLWYTNLFHVRKLPRQIFRDNGIDPNKYKYIPVTDYLPVFDDFIDMLPNVVNMISYGSSKRVSYYDRIPYFTELLSEIIFNAKDNKHVRNRCLGMFIPVSVAPLYSCFKYITLIDFIEENIKTPATFRYFTIDSSYYEALAKACNDDDINTICNLINHVCCKHDWTESGYFIFDEIFGVYEKTKSPILKEFLKKLQDLTICRCPCCACGGDSFSLNDCYNVKYPL